MELDLAFRIRFHIRIHDDGPKQEALRSNQGGRRGVRYSLWTANFLYLLDGNQYR